ncbi:MAG: SIR2 family protein, partial [Betaproteobacteria bacterium HGW-Betaproteobacteria-19]
MTTSLDQIRAGLAAGEIVPFIGADALSDVTNKKTGSKIPATSDELILALNNGQPMSPRLMYEFPRAAMNIELKRGRVAVNRTLESIYADRGWSEAALHQWLTGLKLPYIIDLNRDTGLQQAWADRPHTLIVGIARIAGGLRYKLFRHDGTSYTAAEDGDIDPAAPILFKPCGTPWPEPNWIASDADFVDYITELMGGFAIPPYLKERRKGLRYVVLGARLNRDTIRMLLADFIYGAASPAGWALIPGANDKEKRFCARIGLEVIDADWRELAGLP